MTNPSLRSFKIQKGSSENEIEVHISETPGLKAENLGLATWGSSYILANQLYRWREDALRAQHVSNGTKQDEEKIPVLELGAGTSLVGISAAAVWGLPVIVTDLEPLIAGLAQNIAVNGELGVDVRCGTLDWTEPSSLHIHPTGEVIDTSTRKANVILAADTVYAEDHPELLSKTIETCLARTKEARVVLCYVLRHSYIEIIRELWEGFEGLGLECVEEGQRDAEPDKWDDVAPFEWRVDSAMMDTKVL
ncbi:hypothetical protein PRZ48_005890 [Zasmidium cellare]|uniref:Uncharacterized protein n=1 Tax=Zasmidium cellare TaxID=395010 RepID=A0ABR0EMI6_ZASCE|nr:hypothetical protein PRZ48_005890 [Zasmidium cellare]